MFFTVVCLSRGGISGPFQVVGISVSLVPGSLEVSMASGYVQGGYVCPGWICPVEWNSPPSGCMGPGILWDTANKQTVCILECFLV